MSDVARWLEGLGLARYARNFSENDIAFEQLVDLTDSDLEKLGVASLGHRKRLLAGVAGRAPSNEGHPPAAQAESEGGRRPVAIMFADLTGFTSLGQRLDPEDLHDLLERFFVAVDGAIQSHGGTIDKHIGDCTMGLFGAPTAHGDDAQRAVRAALAARQAVRDLAAESEHAIGVHIGIASGAVVASRTGSDIHSAYTVTGDSVNIASRLADRAVDGEILLADSVYNIVTPMIVAEPAGTVQLDGIADPVETWRVDRLEDEALVHRGVFVGRRAEMHQFDAALTACGEINLGTTILLRGEAGIGKSRLVNEFYHRARQSGFVCHTAFVLDFGAGVERDPVQVLVRSLLGLPSKASRDERQCAMDWAMEDRAIDPSLTVFLIDLLGLPQPPELRSVIDAMDDDTRSANRIDTAVTLYERLSRRQPIQVVIEDIHWADAMTLKAAARFAVATSRAPIILVLTTRKEGDPLDAAWRAGITVASVMSLDLAPLNTSDARTLATAVGGIPETIERCLERAEGNPLFLEQLLRNVGEDERVPESVQSVVLARVDRLEPVDRQALHAAAVLGQRFEAAAARHVLDDADYDFDRLVRCYLVRPEGEGRYIFAHALIRDGAYASLLRGQLRRLHARAADWFEDRDPVLFAEHLALAKEARAARAFLDAAVLQRAAYRSDMALSLIARGRRIATEPRDRFELACTEGEVLLDFGQAQQALASFAAAEDVADEPAQIAWSKLGHASALRLVDRIDEALAILDDAEASAQAAGRTDLLARIFHLRGNLYFPVGRMRDCLTEHTKARDAANAEGSAELKALALGGLADAEYANGLLLSALEHFQDCVSLARHHGLGRIEVANGGMVAGVRCMVGPVSGAYDEATANIETARKVGHIRAEIVCQHAAITASKLTGNFERGLGHLERVHALTAQIGARRFEAENVIFEADLIWRMGQHDKASQLAERAWSICTAFGSHYTGPAVLGILAEVTADPARRRWALQQGEQMLSAGSLSHNHIYFRVSAIDASLGEGQWDEAVRHAAALEATFPEEPTPFTEFLAARGRMLARHGKGQPIDRDDVLDLAARGRDLGFLIYVEAVEQILG